MSYTVLTGSYTEDASFLAAGCDPTRTGNNRAAKARASKGRRARARSEILKIRVSENENGYTKANLKMWILLKLFNFKMDIVGSYVKVVETMLTILKC